MDDTMRFKVYPFGALKDYLFADAISVYNGKWILCKHKDRDTWEFPGGHVEAGETPEQTARRELYEETGATDFTLEPLCDYFVRYERDGQVHEGSGAVFTARVSALGPMPESEMERIGLFDAPPAKLTYPEYTDEIFPLAERTLMPPA